MPECTFFCFVLFVFIPFSSSVHTPPPHSHALMSGWAFSKDIHYRNTELIPPLNLLLSLFSLSLLLLSHSFQIQPSSVFFLSAQQDKPQKGAGSWKTVDWRQPFLSSAGEKQFICPDPQYNFPRVSRGEPAFSWITNRTNSFAQGREFTLTLSLSAFSP